MIKLFLPLAVIVFCVAALFILRLRKKRRLKEALELRLLSVVVPKKHKDEQKADFKDEINLSAQLFSILADLKTHACLEAAVNHVGEEINFFIAVPREFTAPVSRKIEGLWPDAQVMPCDDFNIFNQQGMVAGCFLSQKKSFVLPIRSYVDANLDTFASILSGLSKISAVGEGAAIQVLIGPAGKDSKKEIFKTIGLFKKGAKMSDLFGGMKIGLSDVKDALAEPKEAPAAEKIIDTEAIKTLENRVAKPLVAVNFRAIASAPTQLQADSVLQSVTAGFSQFSSAMGQELKAVKPRSFKNFIYRFVFREFDDSQTMILNIEELASIFHFPSSTTDIPKIKWLKSKEAPPPHDLPDRGTFIGDSLFRGEKKPIFITDEDRRRHVYIIGQTGTGKTNLLMNMAIEDIKAGKGVCIIDPHGEDAEAVLGAVPRERIEDVVIFDPADLERPAAMNMLEYDLNKPEQKSFIVQELFNIFDKLYDMKVAGGPMFEQYFKNAILLLMEDMKNEPATLMEVQRVFTDDDYRNRKVARIFNPTVVDFWEKEAVKATGEHSLANMASYITSKLNNFTANDYVRPIIGQTKSSFNVRKIMDEQKIFLVLLSKGKIGDLNANLLGMVVVGKILMAALGRADMPQEERKDFNLFIDEFQNITTDSTSVILSEARKYRLNLAVAHQFIAQLKEAVRDAVFGNVGSKIVFRIGAPDAEFLLKEFEPVFSQNDLTNIENFNAYAKILINGQPVKPFNLKTHAKPKGDQELVAHAKELSRLKYGRPRQEVEEEIFRRMRG